MFKIRLFALLTGIGLIAYGTAVFAEGHGHDQHMAGGHADMKHTQNAQQGVVTLVGEVIDVACYVRMDASGPDHVKCAEYCIKQGGALGFLDKKSGQVYVVFPEKMGGDPKEKVFGFLGKSVKVTGEVQAKGGLKGITIEKISEEKK